MFIEENPSQSEFGFDIGNKLVIADAIITIGKTQLTISRAYKNDAGVRTYYLDDGRYVQFFPTYTQKKVRPGPGFEGADVQVTLLENEKAVA